MLINQLLRIHRHRLGINRPIQLDLPIERNTQRHLEALNRLPITEINRLQLRLEILIRHLRIQHRQLGHQPVLIVDLCLLIPPLRRIDIFHHQGPVLLHQQQIVETLLHIPLYLLPRLLQRNPPGLIIQLRRPDPVEHRNIQRQRHIQPR